MEDQNKIFGIFTIERAKIQFMQGQTPMPKLVIEDATRPGRPLEADEQNKVVGRCKSSNNNSRDSRKIKSVKRDRSQAHETFRINLQA